MNIKWDSEDYAKNFSFVHEYGNGMMDLVDEGSGVAVDLGCGRKREKQALQKRQMVR